METETPHFNVGSFQCIAVSDGTHLYEPPTFPPPSIFLFSNAPKDELERILRKYNIQPESWDKWISPYIFFMVDTGKHKVLVETGADGLDPNTGKLVQNLKTVGVEQENIDTVVLTHGHPDHIGGNVDDDGNLTFPNANYVMWKREWDFWTSGEAAQAYNKHVSEVLLAFAQKNLPPIEERLDLVDHETEIIPGITTIEAPGHTPGHLAIMVESEDD
jgi:glyoxylase-like metal-dependent hydrolase (beta-lactamase superfamily II)